MLGNSGYLAVDCGVLGTPYVLDCASVLAGGFFGELRHNSIVRNQIDFTTEICTAIDVTSANLCTPHLLPLNLGKRRGARRVAHHTKNLPELECLLGDMFSDLL